jgi:hypothetical protein
LRARGYVKYLSREDPRGVFCGDDALIPQFPLKRRLEYDRAFESLGGRLSAPKSFFNKKKGIFCEQPYENGSPLPFTSISVWSAPPGGSKGQINWFNQPIAASDRLASVGRKRSKGLWTFSPFFHHFAVAFQLGLPVGAPVGEGGLGHPGFMPASLTRHLPWLHFLNSRDLGDVATGFGLNPLPTSSSSIKEAPALMSFGKRWVKAELVLREASARVYNETVAGIPVTKMIGRPGTKFYREVTLVPKPRDLPTTRYAVLENGDLTVPLEDAALRAVATNVSWDLYHRAPLEAIRTPSIRMVVNKFHRKVGKRPWILGSYANVHEKLERMRNTYVLPSLFSDVFENPRGFGLEPAPIRVRRDYRRRRIA